MKKDFGVKPWLCPQTVSIIATFDRDGHADAMNAAWCGMFDDDLVELCLSATHKTTANIKETKAFTVSAADAAHVKECDYLGCVSGNKEAGKLKKAGFTVTKSRFVNAPVINELPFVLECELVRFTEKGTVIGRIVNAAVDESVLSSDGKVDLAKFRPIVFDPFTNCYRVVGEKVGEAFHDGLALR